MSKRGTLPNLLAHAVKPAGSFNLIGSEEARQVLTPWLGSSVVTKMRVDERRRKLAELVQDTAAMRGFLKDLTDAQREILAVCKRYGGVTGAVLTAETVSRGLVEAESEKRIPYYETRKHDPVLTLCNRLLLMGWDGRYLGDRYSYNYGYRLRYPDVALAPALADVIEPAAPLPWPTPPAAPPASVQIRSPAEVAFDLWTVAHALHEGGTWKTNKGGSLAKAAQNRVRKALVPPADDPVAPPDVESLYYELLRGLDAVDITEGEGRLDLEAVQRHLNRPAEQQSWRLVQAWLHAVLWQDGIGVVPDRDSEYDMVRIQPQALAEAKEVIVWALQRVANGSNDWLDLTAFLSDFRKPAGETCHFYWGQYSWAPNLQGPAAKARRDEPFTRERDYWLAEGGVWIANVVLGTLGHLGLVERGDVEKRPRFRLTPLGQAVFAAPAVVPLPETSPQFLTVQPNHEIVAYLNAADPAAVWPLARMARRTSTTSGLVQTFALTRDSVYQALESGLTLEQLQTFLREHSTTGLPANVALSLAEWGRKREALTLRSGVSVLLSPTEPAVLLTKPPPAGKKPPVVVDHQQTPAVCWRVDEDGRVHVTKQADAVALARLSQFAETDGDAWRITAESAHRAARHGFRAEQILAWLTQHADEKPPPLLETMLRNWTDGGGVFLGDLLVLQAPQEQANAVLREHERFRPFILAHVPPNWFIVRPEKRDELQRLLQAMGFATTLAWKPPAPSKHEPEKPKRGRPKKRRR